MIVFLGFVGFFLDGGGGMFFEMFLIVILGGLVVVVMGVVFVFEEGFGDGLNFVGLELLRFVCWRSIWISFGLRFLKRLCCFFMI